MLVDIAIPATLNFAIKNLLIGNITIHATIVEPSNKLILFVAF